MCLINITSTFLRAYTFAIELVSTIYCISDGNATTYSTKLIRRCSIQSSLLNGTGIRVYIQSTEIVICTFGDEIEIFIKHQEIKRYSHEFLIMFGEAEPRNFWANSVERFTNRGMPAELGSLSCQTYTNSGIINFINSCTIYRAKRIAMES
jgi:hypothetical protein